jgi:hypothetical protein
LKGNISATPFWIILKFETEAQMAKPNFTIPSNEDDLQWTMNLKYGIWNISATSVGSYSNFFDNLQVRHGQKGTFGK